MKPLDILLVEDNEGDELLIREALEEGKVAHSLSVARDGQEALLYLEQHAPFESALQPELILLDINLPKKSGHEVLGFIKQHPLIKVIPVIMLTTSSSHHDLMKAYQAHANCFITKPASMDEFLAVVTRIEAFWGKVVSLPTRI
ncbi:MAG: response regulator [Candidatus Sericytochromatia bacterium]